jgi:hypothetical protein
MPPSHTLRFENGPRAGQTVPVPAAGLLIGRKPGNDLVLEDPSVSGRHALLRPEGAGLSVEDLGSTNGTRIEGQRIERHRLEPGQTLRLGNVEFTLLAEGAAPLPAEPTGSGLALEFEDEIVLGGEAPELPARALPAVPAQPAPKAPRPAEMPAAVRPKDPAPAAERRAKPAPARAADVPAETAEVLTPAIGRLDVSRLPSGRGALFAVGALIAAALGTGAFLWMGSGDGQGQARASARLEEPAGNLLGPEWSFEQPEADSALIETESAPLRFGRGRSFAVSGQTGLGLDPLAEAEVSGERADAGGERPWAGVESKPLPVSAGALLRAQVTAWGAEGAQAGLSLAFSSSRGDRPPFELSIAAALGPQASEIDLSLPTLAGFDRVQARLFGCPPKGSTGEAESSLGLALDDWRVTSAPAAAATALGDFALWPVGELRRGEGAPEGPLALLVARQERPLLWLAARADADPRAAHLPLTLGAATDSPPGTAQGISLPENPKRLELWLEPVLLERTERALASLAEAPSEAAGLVYQSHGDQFERSGLRELLIGRDLDLLRLGFAGPVTVRARPVGERIQIAVTAEGPLPRFDLQGVFADERAQAAVESAAARRALSAGRLGEVYARSARLLETAPFERELVAEAEAHLARLSSEGLAELERIEQALERAAFFGLDGMYGECAQRVQALAARHQPFEGRIDPVAEAAARLAERIEDDRQRLARPREKAASLSAPTLREALRAAGQEPLAATLERLASGQPSQSEER